MIKNVLLEIIDFYRYKIVNDKCTSEDMKAAFELLRDNAVSEATIKDIADFYGQSESNVRNIVSRKVASKPKRAVLYNFIDVTKIIPKSWRQRLADK